jgi:hypothetical protein
MVGRGFCVWGCGAFWENWPILGWLIPPGRSFHSILLVRLPSGADLSMGKGKGTAYDYFGLQLVIHFVHFIGGCGKSSIEFGGGCEGAAGYAEFGGRGPLVGIAAGLSTLYAGAASFADCIESST